ncbi:Alanine--tRNA ligase [Phycisphaerae bacterium RAS1]|nr:Alanine--tRNA ligase [Phycisphaerae bacterium RAS1]
MRSASQIRQEFIDFFVERGHRFVPSSPVVPLDDPTLLFTNAGMNQFKDVFLGAGERDYRRAANTQKCIRAGGKHNDLDDVGHDTYHHTFFEMLGNWSFGDYFKKEAIEWAWTLLTKVWGIDGSRLHATYFQGDADEGLEPDLEAKQLWASVTDIDRSHIHPGNKKDNFWEMGDTGPCGPCSEIHIDLTPDKSGAALVNGGDPRVIEIWNLVFIQFNRVPGGKLTILPSKHVDTGMGFERVTAVLQGKRSNYDTDVFAPLFQAVREVTRAPAYTGLLESDNGDRTQTLIDVAYRVVADHARTLTFALTDGALPDKEGRGYVLRRILRRAVRYGWQYLNMHEPFVHRLVPAVVQTMGAAFPELTQDPGRVAEVLRDEEESFGRTLERGLALFEEAAAHARRDHRGEIQGLDAFRLHDTFGFPIDLTQIMAQEKGLQVDIGEYERLMDEARERARAGGKSAERWFEQSPFTDTATLRTKFVGYHELTHEARVVLSARWSEGWHYDGLRSGDEGALILDETPFYAEMGGQVGDVGVVRGRDGDWEFLVEATRRSGDAYVHYGRVASGEIAALGAAEGPRTRGGRPGRTVLAEGVVQHETRHRVMRNHTATHVLNWALRETLGDGVNQRGSLVDSEKTRFDFSHNKPVAAEDIEKIESLTNEQVEKSLQVYAKEVPLAQAQKLLGVRAVFGEKYPDPVRVVSIGKPVDLLLHNPENPEWSGVSIEFCGGTHVPSTSHIGRFVLISEEGVAKGVRRVVGVSGDAADEAVQMGRMLLRRADQIRGGPRDQLAAGLSELQTSLTNAVIPLRDRFRLRDQMGELQEMMKKEKKAASAGATGLVNERVFELLSDALQVGSTSVVVGEMPDVPAEQLKRGADLVKAKCGSAAILFAIRTADGRATLLAAMSDDLNKRGLRAGDLVKAVAPMIEGGGGGPATMAQAGGKNPHKISDVLAAGRTWIEEKLRAS